MTPADAPDARFSDFPAVPPAAAEELDHALEVLRQLLAVHRANSQLVPLIDAIAELPAGEADLALFLAVVMLDANGIKGP